MDTNSYKIVRKYENDRRDRVQKRGLTLTEAQAHCSDPETSSMTARQPNGCDSNGRSIQKWHDLKKHWFDGYELER